VRLHNAVEGSVVVVSVDGEEKAQERVGGGGDTRGEGARGDRSRY
jgi:hypothetical protein